MLSPDAVHIIAAMWVQRRSQSKMVESLAQCLRDSLCLSVWTLFKQESLSC